MNTIRRPPVTGLFVAAVWALLLANCVRLNPKTFVLGAVTCTPRAGEPRCDDCVRQSCCAEFQTCANDAPCPCYLYDRIHRTHRTTIVERCGQPNAAYQALEACMNVQCRSECSWEHPLMGKPAPEISTAEFLHGGGPKTLKEALGKVVILSFWSASCEPCKKSFPIYQAIEDKFAGDVVVIAISVDDPETAGREQLEAIGKESHTRFAFVWDKDNKVRTAYFDRLSLPWVAIIDRDGNLRQFHGYGAGDDAKILAEVQSLMGPVRGSK